MTLRTARNPSVEAQCSARRYDRGDAHHRRGRPPRRPGSRPARGGHHGPWAAVHPGWSRHGQDPRDHAPGRVRPGDRSRPAVRRPGRHVHGQGRNGDARSSGGGWATGRVGVHVPCGGPAPTPAFLAAHPRPRPARGPLVEGAAPRAAGAHRCPAATATWPSGTSRPRSSGRRHAGSRPRATPTASSRSGTTVRCRRTSWLRFYRDYETARDRAGLIDFEDMLAMTVELIESDEAVAAEVRGALSMVLGRRVPGHEPAPAGAAGRLARRSR